MRTQGRVQRRVGRAVVIVALLVVSAPGSAPLALAAPASWSWPVSPPHRVVRPFIAPETPYSAGHRGIDIAGIVGQIVRAPADGVVHFSGWVVDRPVVSIRHAGGVMSSVEPVAGDRVAGEVVARGEVIGVLEAGHCVSPCLHLGARRFGEYVSPVLFLGGIPRSVLLPTRHVG